MSKIFNNRENRVIFEEVSNCLNPFEVVFISSCIASQIVKSGKSLVSKGPYKEKVAMVAFNSLCDNLDPKTEKDNFKNYFFKDDSSEEQETDTYEENND